jgi:hypothetical protein
MPRTLSKQTEGAGGPEGQEFRRQVSRSGSRSNRNMMERSDSGEKKNNKGQISKSESLDTPRNEENTPTN